MQKSSQSDPSPRVRIFFFLAHNPKYPQKILPADAGPGDFDGHPAFASGDVGDLEIENFALGSIFWFLEKDPHQVRIKTHRVQYEGMIP